MIKEDTYSDLPKIETERLILRKITKPDVPDMYAYCSDPEVTRFVTWNPHQSLADTEAFVEFILNNYKKKSLAPWGMEYKKTGKIIGTVDLASWNPTHQSAEIAYCIHQDYWGCGLTTEAAKSVIAFGFSNMDLIRIQARCFVANIGSERVMEKLGMTFEGIVRKGMLVKGKHEDLKLYSILKEEFELIEMN
ncbi:GNAT family protein [Oceanobacillus profundus]|uniref:GNAT family N-acetyltransferase n=1 Tax=Oceanobacillus TaxID=182709 RepID=UPI0026E48394|nr:GNAT family protein [Oceanobacillus profundus]MDO6448413.1 GNAT family protein [Oceanobacillus profundus]